jgi:hypothetical protein
MNTPNDQNPPNTSNFQPQYPQQPYPNYPPQGFPQQQPPKKKKRWPWIVGGIVVILALCGVIGAISNAGGATTNTTPPATTTNQPAPTTAPTTAPKPLVWKTVKTISGSGSEKTDTFTVPSTWKLTWTCDPASFQNIQYNVIAIVEDSSGTMVDSGVNALCKPGTTSGSTNVTSGGTVRLDITSEGDWTFNIQTQQ